MLDKAAAFWMRTRRTNDDSCWLWLGTRWNNPSRPRHLWYGRLRWDGRPVYAHRKAWELTFGEIPPGLCVLHRCDTPLCVRPGHLFVGTKPDNTEDMTQKGRQARGVGIGTSKLDEAAVRGIRTGLKIGLSRAALAEAHHVSRVSVAKIARKETWQWL